MFSGMMSGICIQKKDICRMKMGKIIIVSVLFFLYLQNSIYGSIDINSLIEKEKKQSERIQWPGFNPMVIPALIFDGTDSYLVNHPSPPAEFTGLSKNTGIFIFQGRHKELRANTAIEINGIRTAAVDISLSGNSETVNIAALLLHEKFHCFQLTNKTDWGEFPNELAVFEYPADDPNLLKLVYLEMKALINAYDSKTDEESIKWIKLAAKLRADRYKVLPASCREYERAVEPIEGTAFYIQHKASGKDPRNELGEKLYSSDSIRIRGYITGSIMCFLLDRLTENWKSDLNPARGFYIDTLLQKIMPAGIEAAVFDPYVDEKERISAQKAVDDYMLQRIILLDSFISKPGYKIILDCGKRPLWPSGFDPMNIEKLNKIELLHKRWLKLSGERAELEILGTESMTEGAKDHPLFNGVKKVVIAGLSDKPEIILDNRKIKIKNSKINIEIENAEIDNRENALFIYLK